MLVIHKSSLGLLSTPVPAFDYGIYLKANTYDGAGIGERVLARSEFYDQVQRLASPWIAICPVLPFGVYSGEEKVVKNGRTTSDDLNSSLSPSELLWEANSNVVDVTLYDFWRNDELKRKLKEGGGYARAIMYYAGKDFDETVLINPADLQCAQDLQLDVLRLKALLYAICSHPFFSPSSFVVFGEVFCVILCTLWLFVYGASLVIEMKSERSRKILDFEIIFEEQKPAQPEVTVKGGTVKRN